MAAFVLVFLVFCATLILGLIVSTIVDVLKDRKRKKEMANGPKTVAGAIEQGLGKAPAGHWWEVQQNKGNMEVTLCSVDKTVGREEIIMYPSRPEWVLLRDLVDTSEILKDKIEHPVDWEGVYGTD